MSDEQRDYETNEGLRIVTIAGLCIIIALVLMGMWSTPVVRVTFGDPLPALMATATPQLVAPTVYAAEPQISHSGNSLTIVNNTTTIYQDDHSSSYACIGYCP